MHPALFCLPILCCESSDVRVSVAAHLLLRPVTGRSEVTRSLNAQGSFLTPCCAVLWRRSKTTCCAACATCPGSARSCRSCSPARRARWAPRTSMASRIHSRRSRRGSRCSNRAGSSQWQLVGPRARGGLQKRPAQCRWCQYRGRAPIRRMGQRWRDLGLGTAVSVRLRH